MSNKRKKPSNTFWTLVIMLVINLIAKFSVLEIKYY